MNEDTTVITPDPAPQYVPPHLLRRSSNDRMVGGVCGGLGQRYGIDPSILRVAFVVAILAAGFGLLSYVALWLLIPADSDPRPGTLTRSLWKLVLGALIGVGAVAALMSWVPWLLLIPLIGIAIWAYAKRDTTGRWSPPTGSPANPPTSQSTRDQVPATGSPDTGITSPVAPPVAGFAHGGTGVVAPPATAEVPPTPQRRSRSYLGLYTMLVVLVVGSTLATFMGLGWLNLGIVAFFAILLLLVGGGLIVAAFVGRARWLIAPGLVLAVVLAAVAYLPALLGSFPSGGIGERTWTPTSATSKESFTLGIGEGTLDLTEWANDPTAAPPVAGDRLEAALGIGELVVLIPSGWDVQITGDVGLGDAAVAGVDLATDNDPTISFSERLLPAGEPTGVLALDLDVRVGQIEVQRVPTSNIAIGEEPIDVAQDDQDGKSANDSNTNDNQENKNKKNDNQKNDNKATTKKGN